MGGACDDKIGNPYSLSIQSVLKHIFMLFFLSVNVLPLCLRDAGLNNHRISHKCPCKIWTDSDPRKLIIVLEKASLETIKTKRGFELLCAGMPQPIARRVYLVKSYWCLTDKTYFPKILTASCLRRITRMQPSTDLIFYTG